MKTSSRHRSTALLGAVLLSVVLLSAPTGAGASEAGGEQSPAPSGHGVPRPTGVNVGVVMQSVRFSPAEVTVRVGDTVTWIHKDSQLSHHAADHNGAFDSRPTCGRPFGVCMKAGDTFSFTFLEAGTYHYHCRPHAKHHAGMVGTITVVE